MSLDDPPTATEAPEDGTVLVVDDEPQLAGMYAAMLEDRYTVRTATSGATALDRLSPEVDVMLLDRRMPGLSGDEVLETVREEEHDCQVAMVTSVDPGVDVADMAFDAYLVKPFRQQDLRDVVESLLLRAEFSRDTQELLSITSRMVTLASRIDEETLATHDEYQTLRERRERLEEANHDRIATLLNRGQSRFVFRDVLREMINT